MARKSFAAALIVLGLTVVALMTVKAVDADPVADPTQVSVSNAQAQATPGTPETAPDRNPAESDESVGSTDSVDPAVHAAQPKPVWERPWLPFPREEETPISVRDAHRAGVDAIESWRRSGFVGIIDYEVTTAPSSWYPTEQHETCRLYIGARGEVRLDMQPLAEGGVPWVCTVANGQVWMHSDVNPLAVWVIPYPAPEPERSPEVDDFPDDDWDFVRVQGNHALLQARKFGCGLLSSQPELHAHRATRDGEQVDVHASCSWFGAERAPMSFRGCWDERGKQFLLCRLESPLGTTVIPEYRYVAEGVVIPAMLESRNSASGDVAQTMRVTGVVAKEPGDKAFHEETFLVPYPWNGGGERFPQLQATFLYDRNGDLQIQYWDELPRQTSGHGGTR
jgi:hypothetical protein